VAQRSPGRSSAPKLGAVAFQKAREGGGHGQALNLALCGGDSGLRAFDGGAGGFNPRCHGL
jgi:hypothetical protein